MRQEAVDGFTKKDPAFVKHRRKAIVVIITKIKIAKNSD